MTREFWRNFAIDSFIGVMVGLHVALFSWVVGRPMYWLATVVGVCFIALLTWNPGGEK